MNAAAIAMSGGIRNRIAMIGRKASDSTRSNQKCRAPVMNVMPFALWLNECIAHSKGIAC